MDPDDIRYLGHELANALTALSGNIDVLRATLEEGGSPEALELVTQAREACDRATELTRRIADAARGPESARPDSAAAAPSTASPADLTILLCEDMDSIRRSTRMVLRSHGYKVLDVATAAAARELAADPGAIDLLLADVELADGDGPSLAADLAASRPGLRVLYVSGHAAGTVELPAGAPVGRYLEKPFSSDTLLKKVREMLGS